MDRKRAVSETKKTGRTGLIGTVLAVLFWLLAWQLLSMRIRNNILVASPAKTVSALWDLWKTMEFWQATGLSFAKIAGGFFLGVSVGILLAVLAKVFRPVWYLITPVLRLIKAVPVASFIILALLWVSSRQLSVLISFLMVLPIVYTNVLQGICAADPELLEMANVFSVGILKRIRYIYLPAVLPYFVSACSVGLGFCFKSGIAAEIIGLPDHSIGEKLYEAKLYLMTGELFAWTAVIVWISFCFEHLFMALIRFAAKKLCGYEKSGGATEKKEVPETESRRTEDSEEERTENKKIERLKKEELLSKEQAAGTVFRENAEYGLFSVSKAFEEKKVLEQFSLPMPSGKTVSLMGPSGSGKSTAGKLLLGLVLPDEGEVRNGKRRSAVFQEDRLCSEFDALTNVMLAAKDKEQARQALTEVGILEPTGKPVARFSGGMKRRVAIVRAVLANAEMVVLDEPFTGLDENSRKKMMAWVRRRLEGKTVLLITHRTDEAEELGEQMILLE